MKWIWIWILSALLTFFSLLNVSNGLGRIILAGASVLFVFIPLVVIPLVLRRFEKTRKHRKWVSIIPSLLFSIYVFANFSDWAQRRIIFDMVMDGPMPSSVRNFHYREDSWTDYMVEFYCEIPAEDLEMIIESGRFGDGGKAHRYSRADDFLESQGIEPVIWEMSYGYALPNHTPGRPDGWCEILVGESKDRFYAFYTID